MTSTNISTTTCDEGQQSSISPPEQVILWLIEGHRDADIKEAIREKWPTVDPQQLLTTALEHFAQAARCEEAVVHGWALEAYRDLYRRMVKIGDFSNALKAIRELLALTTQIAKTTAKATNDEPATNNDGLPTFSWEVLTNETRSQTQANGSKNSRRKPRQAAPAGE